MLQPASSATAADTGMPRQGRTLTPAQLPAFCPCRHAWPRRIASQLRQLLVGMLVRYKAPTRPADALRSSLAPAATIAPALSSPLKHPMQRRAPPARRLLLLWLTPSLLVAPLRPMPLHCEWRQYEGRWYTRQLAVRACAAQRWLASQLPCSSCTRQSIERQRCSNAHAHVHLQSHHH